VVRHHGVTAAEQTGLGETKTLQARHLRLAAPLKLAVAHMALPAAPEGATDAARL
jgi:hypothetical protein